MLKRQEIYVTACGSIVEVMHGGDGDLFCCGAAMKKLDPKTQDQGREKHVPVVEAAPGGVLVKVGSVPHPMESAHYIEWIEVYDHLGTQLARRYLAPGDKPEAFFALAAEASGTTIAREYCNVHGHWRS